MQCTMSLRRAGPKCGERMLASFITSIIKRLRTTLALEIYSFSAAWLVQLDVVLHELVKLDERVSLHAFAVVAMQAI